MSESTQTENDFSTLVATNAELVKDIIAKGQIMQRKDAKYIENLQERYLLTIRHEELRKKNGQQQAEIESLKNQIRQIMEPAPASVVDLIEFEGNPNRRKVFANNYFNFCRIMILPESNGSNESLEALDSDERDDLETWLSVN